VGRGETDYPPLRRRVGRSRMIGTLLRGRWILWRQLLLRQRTWFVWPLVLLAVMLLIGCWVYKRKCVVGCVLDFGWSGDTLVHDWPSFWREMKMSIHSLPLSNHISLYTPHHDNPNQFYPEQNVLHHHGPPKSNELGNQIRRH
jgi:hypothetical protein